MNLIKKTSILIIAFLVTLTTMACASKNVTSLRNKQEIWGTYSTLKVLQSGKEYDKMDASISVYACKDELESAQIIITPNEDVKEVSVSLSDLKSKNGDTFSKDNIAVYYQRYIELEKKSVGYKNDEWPIGFYPDMLLPMETAIEYKENSIKKNDNQGLTFDFDILEDTKAGIYSGEFIIKCDTASYAVPVELVVWDITLDKAYGETCFNIWQRTLMYGELDNSDEMYQKYFEVLLNDYKVCAEYLPNCEDSAEEFVKQVKKYWNNKYLTTINIPIFGGSYQSTYGEAYGRSFNEAEYKNYVKTLALACTPEELYLERVIVYPTTVDEPQTDEQARATKAIVEYIRNNNDKVYDELVEEGFFNDYGGENSEFAIRMKNAIDEIEIVVTAQEVELYGDSMDSCCPYISKYATEYDGEMLRENGNGVWMYTCTYPPYPYPSLQIDDYLVGTRLMRWVCKANDIDGYLFWGVSEYYNQGVGILVNAYDDPARYIDGPNVSNGDGYIFYPGYKYGIYGPIGSIRALAVRDSQEDFDLLSSLEEKINELSVYYNSSEVNYKNATRDLFSSVTNRAVYNLEDIAFTKARSSAANLTIMAQKSNIFVSDVLKENSEFYFTIYAPNDYEIKINNEVINGEVSGNGYKYKINFDSNTKLNVKISNSDYSYSFTKTSMGEVYSGADLSNPSSNPFIFDEHSTSTISDNKLNVSMSSYGQTLFEQLNYYPYIELEKDNFGISLDKVDSLYFTVTNNSDKDVKMTIYFSTAVVDNLAEKVSIKAHETKVVEIKKVYDMRFNNLSKTHLKFVFENLDINNNLVGDREISIYDISYTKKGAR